MQTIPEEYRRVLEARVDAIVVKHSSSVNALTSWMFEIAFGGCKLLSIEGARPLKLVDHRASSGDILAYGQTDVEVVASLETPDGQRTKAALLIEDKVDAREMTKQGLRYQARARHELLIGSWQTYACVLIAPQSYLDSHYPFGNSKKFGWDYALSFEDMATRIPDSIDVATLIEATQSSNSWNKPIPAAVQFWEDFRQFGDTHWSTVPVFVNTQRGSKVRGVWPSFYENQLKGNTREPSRKRVKIVHMDTADYVSLFIIRVEIGTFAATVNPILEEGMTVAPAGTSWQSIRIKTGPVDPLQPLDIQITTLNKVFETAKLFYEFFLSHENKFLSILTNS